MLPRIQPHMLWGQNERWKGRQMGAGREWLI